MLESLVRNANGIRLKTIKWCILSDNWAFRDSSGQPVQGIQPKNNNNGKAQMFVILLLASMCPASNRLAGKVGVVINTILKSNSPAVTCGWPLLLMLVRRDPPSGVHGWRRDWWGVGVEGGLGGNGGGQLARAGLSWLAQSHQLAYGLRTLSSWNEKGTESLNKSASSLSIHISHCLHFLNTTFHT